MVARLIIFDLDGTLVKSNIDYEKIRKEVKNFLKKRGLKGDWSFKPIIDQIDQASIYLAQEKNISSEDIKKTAYEIIESNEIFSLDKAEILPGVEKVLKKLKERNVKLGIFSRNSRKWVERVAQKLGVKFDVIYSRELGNKPKPDPEGIIFCSKALNIPISDVLMVGDHPYDIEAGRKAQVKSFGVLTGVGSEEDLKKSGADKIIKNLLELVSL